MLYANELDALEAVRINFLINLGFEREGTLSEENVQKFQSSVNTLRSIQNEIVGLGGEATGPADEYLRELEENKDQEYRDWIGN